MRSFSLVLLLGGTTRRVTLSDHLGSHTIEILQPVVLHLLMFEPAVLVRSAVDTVSYLSNHAMCAPCPPHTTFSLAKLPSADISSTCKLATCTVIDHMQEQKNRSCRHLHGTGVEGPLNIPVSPTSLQLCPPHPHL